MSRFPCKCVRIVIAAMHVFYSELICIGYRDDLESGEKRFVGTFFEQVYGIVAKIPYGKVASYGQIARMLGNPRSARMVGWALSCCPEHLPWQRVVMADGSITGGGYADLRRTALETENVAFLADGRVDMASCQWRPEST